MQILNFQEVKDREYFKQFDIRFGSLALGEHQLEVEINRPFFEKYKNEDIQDGDIQVNITIERKETMVTLYMDMHGFIVSVCDVCLENLTVPIAKKETVILKTTGIAKESDSENIVFVGEKAYFYNIEQLLYENIVTSIPMRKVHQEIGEENCNPEMLKWIEEAKNASPKQEDERWAALKEKFE